MEKKLKSWQGWLLFCGAMVVVFCAWACCLGADGTPGRDGKRFQ